MMHIKFMQVNFPRFFFVKYENMLFTSEVNEHEIRIVQFNEELNFQVFSFCNKFSSKIGYESA